MTEGWPDTDTIAAISTPPGRGGIGIVRLSGPLAATIASELVRCGSRLSTAARGWPMCPISRLRCGQRAHRRGRGDLLCRAEFVHRRGPGGNCRARFASGARSSSAPGHWSWARAWPSLANSRSGRFLAGRIDLTQAEAVRDLIEAQTLTQARQAASQMGGALSRRVAPVKQALVELIALLEAGIDFAEDDIDVAPQAEIARRISELGRHWPR